MGLLARSSGTGCSWGRGVEAGLSAACPSAGSPGLFPEDDVPEAAYRSLLEGRRDRKAKRRPARSQLQSKTGG